MSCVCVQVLQQEHLERARQNPNSAAASGVRDNVDNSTFFQNLPPDLRRAILSDMDDSLISHLPEEMRTEAQTLRQERDSRRRHMLEQRHAFLERMMEEAHLRSGHLMDQRHAFQERMLEEAHIRSTADAGGILPSSLPQLSAHGMRYAVVNLNPHMLDGHILTGTQTGGSGYLSRGGPHGGRGADQSSKQMLDQEALTCLLVLLFLDQSKLHNNRLHRIIKNLSQHSPTRAWILSSLLAIIREMGKTPSVQTMPSISSSCPMPPPLMASTVGMASASGSSVAAGSDSDVGVAPVGGSGGVATSTPMIVTPHHYSLPHWLDISINAALGSHAKIFQLEGESGSSSKGTSGNRINIHPLAGTTISHNVLDVLIFLARHFGSSFLPADLVPKDKVSADEKKEEGSDVVSNFWQILLRLDGGVGRKGKSTMKGFKFSENKESLTEQERFSSSIIGQLMTLFTHDIVAENVALTDKLLRLLSVASSSIPRTGMRSLMPANAEVAPKNSTPFGSPGGVNVTTGESASTTAVKSSGGESEDVFESTVRMSVVAPPLLSSVISVLTSGKCSEEGLEEATTLLTNLSKCSIPTREQILYMLLSGVRTIGRTLCSQIIALDESVNAKLHEETLEKEQLQYQQDGGGKKKKGASSSSGVLSGVQLSGVEEQHMDHSHDLHIPTMAPLTCKGSQQSFFVRMLKVVCQLRESAQLALNAAASAAATSKTAGAAATSSQQSSTTPTQMQSSTAEGAPAGGEGIQNSVEGTTSNSEVAQAAEGGSSLQIQNETQEGSTSQSKSGSAVDDIVVEHKPAFLQMLSEQLELDELWSILSNCLDALSHTEDPHAVFVLQPTVEAFFLVHANYKDDGQKGKKRTAHTSSSRFSRLSSSSHMLDNESNPASPAPFSPLPGTPGLENDVDPFAHLPPDTAKFLKFAGKPAPPSFLSSPLLSLPLLSFILVLSN